MNCIIGLTTFGETAVGDLEGDKVKNAMLIRQVSPGMKIDDGSGNQLPVGAILLVPFLKFGLKDAYTSIFVSPTIPAPKEIEETFQELTSSIIKPTDGEKQQFSNSNVIDLSKAKK